MPDLSDNRLIMENTPFISIAIPAFNEEKYIGDCLDSLNNLDYPKDRYEIIVETSGSTDQTAQIARSKGVVVLDQGERLGVSGARQAASAMAKGEIIAATDADTLVPRNWLKMIVEDLSQEKIVGVTGPVRTYDRNLWHKFVFMVSFEIYYLMGIFSRQTYFSGMNFAIKKDIFDKIGGFNHVLKAGEDTDLANRASRFGKIIYDRRITVLTSNRRLKEGLFQSMFRYGKTYLAVKRNKPAPDFEDFR